MRAALLLVDFQRDYLQRADLCPPARTVIAATAALLSAFRQLELPVFHVHTMIRSDGSNRMPHWQRSGTWACVEGTEGALPPDEVAPRGVEPVFHKQYFSAFGNAKFHPALQQLGIGLLVVAGVHTHGCVRATVLDAYQAGFDVWVAADAVASYDPVHAELTQMYLDERACQFLSSRQILQRLPKKTPLEAPSEVQRPLPVGCVDGVWLAARDHDCELRRDPADWSTRLATVPLGRSEDVKRAIAAAGRSQTCWGATEWTGRAALLTAWHGTLLRHGPEIVSLLASELGKPQAEASAELQYALALLSATANQDPGTSLHRCAERVRVRHCPLGIVGIVTPWNNPLAIPVGKIAPALMWGNSVVWKPALEAPRLAMLLMDSLAEAGVPPGCVNLVFGGAATVQPILRDPRIAAVSFTGSSSAGRQVAAVCAAHGKRVQAELGGNNAAVVTDSCNIDAAARDVAGAAFSFAGQRCTAVRRVIVECAIRGRFEAALLEAISALPVGLPLAPSTRIGPLISRTAQQRIAAVVATAREEGGVVHCGGRTPTGLQQGCWYEPTLLSELDQRSPVVQTESFGPVLILSDAANFDEAIYQVNAVEQGLTATLYCDDPQLQQQFVESVESGMVWVQGRYPAIDARAPFGGWKASAIGPPEHGEWDRTFYSRPKAIYGGNDDLGM